MKVYILHTFRGGESFDVDGVFSTEEKARTYAIKHDLPIDVETGFNDWNTPYSWIMEEDVDPEE